MTRAFKKTETEHSSAVGGIPAARQVAALCYRDRGEGTEVLLITSRDTGRWIVPKGWMIPGLDASGAALQEAWEEAGVRDAVISSSPIGSYAYDKRLDDGSSLPVRAEVYAAHVLELKDTYPEADERERRWFTPPQASKLVEEPELQSLLRKFGGRHAQAPCAARRSVSVPSEVPQPSGWANLPRPVPPS